ncbi:uncharacterized protein LOC127864955 [Dreissena polymorpha]|uniref:Uncharacterized protein n=1 Tax=Dreissena polymorpha TaxID=45954 RepID=A0A9D4MPL6_DREPO|nr:uncharacterized protein LOC127864955 [Dreissena polymorpha]XP_052260811.1 uncharacterized protein LOC127864955 [Dreissena polymorpha]KAH3878997.1 hypothetical protein DPMN_002898 [Dreissena polymorpha]
MTSQHDIRDCRDEMTHVSRGSQDTIRKFPVAYLLLQCIECIHSFNTLYNSRTSWAQENLGSRVISMSQEHLLSSSPDYEIPMLHNPQSMNSMQREPWTPIDEIKPANQKDSLLLPLLSY